MYLKSIEVQGFKSFANKLTFSFQEGITGIVGPNGSGKSNVADAVRWVLGEQSAKQLRSGNMQDVIFAGTELRKPQSFASVAITFDNADRRLDVDYEEVTVTRRLYRSGESEYLINNTPVRLRDINEIFYDTGIGQEGYSIIGQGQIDRILSAKSDERRELFDEAAGIVKFKKRKKQALKKLEEEHQNLVRVNDILKELSSQLEPLRKQSETARIYLDKKQALKDLDINLFQIEEERTETQLGELTSRLEIAQGDMQETTDAFERTRAEYDAIEHEIEDIDSDVLALTDKASKNALIRQQLLGQIDLMNEQIRTLTISSRQYEERKEQLASDIAAREKALSEGEKEIADAEKEYRDIQATEELEAGKLADLDVQLFETEQAIEQAKQDVIDMLEDRASVKGRMQRYDTMLEQMEIRRSEISGRLLRLKEEEKAAQDTSSRQEEAVRSLSLKAEAVSAREKECEEAISVLRAEMGEANTRLDEMTTRFHRSSSRLESLRSMAEHYDGYGNGIRKIMEQKGRNPGIRGVVADLILAPKQYETAIETALGGSIRNVVTDNEATAKYLIEYLKSGKYGRATFLPLTSIKARSVGNEEVLREQGVIGVASSLVRCEEEYRTLCEYLLGRVVVVDTIDNAIRIGRRFRHSIYMVTLQGESFAPGGSITGGAFKNQDNLLGRRREIEELDAGTKKLKAEIERLRGELEGKRQQRNERREALSAAGEELQRLQLQLNTAQMALKQAEEQHRLSRINSDALEKESREIEQQIEEVKSRNSGISRTLRESESAEAEANERSGQLRTKEEELKEKRAAQAAALEDVHVKMVSISEKRSFQEQNYERLQGELESLRSEEATLALSISGSGDEAEEKRAQIGEIEKTIESAKSEAASDEERRQKLLERKKVLSDSHREFFEKRDELSGRMSQLDREIYRLNSQKEKLEEGREGIVSYMWEEYNLTPSEIRKAQLPGKKQDRQAVRKEISSLKEAIRKLGSINVNAIEDYKSVSERHTFLSGQHEDLIKSEETLTGIIEELDQGMRRQFAEKFAIIREEFDKAFRELFGGGRGTIEIDPGADLLEAGITIIAHPPGKKLQNMMQLSGGEKALTAIALLFAIQNMKPSPFCLLDEIEAALDESNVVHYAHYLHKLTKNTQFIVITHRRGTMTAADRLYGITMQEKGVSTMVSVNLIEDKLTG